MPPPTVTSNEGPKEEIKSIKPQLSGYKIGKLLVQEVGAAAYKHLWEEGAILRRLREQARAVFTSNFAHRYTPLPPLTSSIRLLSIKPGNGGEIIECFLRITNLMHEAPTYTALSYSWTKDTPWRKKFLTSVRETSSGSIQEQLRILMRKDQREQTGANVPEQKYQKATEIIICDGIVIKVTPSLYDALLRLRQRPPQEYWIDALCINQADDKEKNSQVQIMGQIYRKAELVLVWLGTLPPGFRHRHGNIDRTFPQLVSAFSDDATAFFDEDAPANTGGKGNFDMNISSFRDFEIAQASLALGHLLSRRYFQRVWVVQEIALSKSVTFLLGHHYFGPETFFKVVDFIRSPPFTRTGQALESGWLMSVLAPHYVAQFTSMPLPHPSQPAETDRTGTWSLHDWLETCMSRKAGDDKDLAFAGLSLVQPDLLQIRQSLQLSEASRPPLSPRSGVQVVAQSHHSPAQGSGDSKLWPRLKADYSTSRHEVLVNLAACVLSGPDPSALLSISSRYRSWNETASSSGYNPTLAPSWVPALVPWTKLQHKVYSLGDYGVGCSAATQLQNDFRISSDGSTLLLSATRLGGVQKRLVPPGIMYDYATYPVDSDGCETLRLVWELCELWTSYDDTDITIQNLASFASASTWGLHDSDEMVFQGVILGFCLVLASDITAAICACDEEARKWSALTPLEKRLLNIKQRAQDYQQQSEKGKQELREAYETLKQAYPDVPWPESGMQTTYSEEESLSIDLYLGSCILEWASVQRLFITDTGYIGQTMTGATVGDEVVLVHGASVPYIFRRVDDAIREEIRALRQNTKSDKDHELIKDLEGRLGERDGWVVVGEAYVEGVMDGEAAGECFDRGERFNLV